MAKDLIWATAEDLARNRGRVPSLYRQILRSLNLPDMPLNLAAKLSKKSEIHEISSSNRDRNVADTGKNKVSMDAVKSLHRKKMAKDQVGEKGKETIVQG